MISKFPIGKIINTLKNHYGDHEFNLRNKRDPYRTLISCILSLRTKDEVTNVASLRLFERAKDLKGLEYLPVKTIEKLIYPVGFYRTKAKTIKDIALKLNRDNSGKIPDTMEQLLELNGVGRKTANLVLSLGYGKYGICVDTHVHRISNRLGYVKAKDPFETEMALRAKLPRPYWHDINYVLVLHGQRTCKPIGPRCLSCPVSPYCRKVGVDKKYYQK